ncbi:TRAP transporter small permease subunit [Marinobacter fonticola]|uniref:TRAP transporter small permease subunit n=1 Tax=Marinobacter fonticola TaxID=2603215 RepID=UPI0011E807B0|nr:TRAP transporter small permease [Marinobacter fonticola]
MSNSLSRPAPALSGVTGAYVRVMDALSVATGVIAGLLLCFGVLAVCHMVFVRYAMGESTTWQTEFTTYAISGAMLLGAPYVLLTNGHVAVTILPDALSNTPRKIMNFVASLCGLAFCAALTYGAWVYMHEAYTMGWTTGTVWNPPLWPAVVPMAVGSTLLSLQYVAELIREAR